VKTSEGVIRLTGVTGSERWVKNVVASIQAVRPETLPEPAWTPDGVMPVVKPAS
jgi:hypothetical protein